MGMSSVREETKQRYFCPNEGRVSPRRALARVSGVMTYRQGPWAEDCSSSCLI